MKTLFIKLFFILFLSVPVFGGDENLAQSMEIKFTPELVSLAQELNHDPVKIYQWVYNNIVFEDYDGSRKNALSTYWTKRANEWDQTSLLITLMRISGIEARYVTYGKNLYQEVVAEVLVSVDNFGISSTKTWVPLAPWSKKYKIQEGLDLFPDGNIPDELNFDFDAYVQTIKQETALELFEKKVQKYLDVHYPGKSLKDIPYKKIIIENKSSILPLSLPKELYAVGTVERFSEISNENRAQVKIYVKRDSDKAVLMEHIVYLPEISTSRLVLDFLPNSEADRLIINQYGLISKTPTGKANVKAVLRLDGTIINESLALQTGEMFIDSHEINGQIVDRPKKQAGTLLTYSFDILNVSEQYLAKLKSELNETPLSSLDTDNTKEEYLGRYAYIINSQYQKRTYEAIVRVDELLYVKRVLGPSSFQPTRVYTFLDDINPSNDEKYLIHPSWNIDASTRTGSIYKIPSNDEFSFTSIFGTFSSHLYTYGSSYNEGLIFEDWQSTPSASTIKTLMVANEQGIPVVTITKDNINGHIYALKNQTVDRYSDATIQSFIDAIQNDNAEITTALRKVRYEGLVMSASLTFADKYRSYMFNMNHGGGSTETSTENTTVESIEIQNSLNSFFDEYTYSFTDPSTDVVTSNNLFVPESGLNLITSAGDPVDMAKGEFYQVEKSDISLKSRGQNLEIQRTYKSQSIYNGAFGYGWTWKHMERLLFAVNGDIIYYNKDGIPLQIKVAGSTYTYPYGATFTLAKDLNSYILTQKDKSKIIFNTEGFLTKKEDAYGNSLTFEYNDKFNISKILDSHSKYLKFQYNANGKVETLTDSLGRIVSYEYDGDDLISFTDLAGNTTRYEYLKNQDNPANNHNMSKYILPNDDYLAIGYYKNDQVSHHTNKKDETFHFQYSRYNRYSETWDEEGYYRKIFFNDSNDVTRINTEEGTIELKEYDTNHNMVSYTDANGNKSTYTYDSKRNLLSKTNTLDEVWIYEYDSRHNKRTKTINPQGVEELAFYDENGNLIKAVDSLSNETLYEYDIYGNLIRTTDALGGIVLNEYGSEGLHLVKTTDKNQNTTVFTYDEIGNQVSILDAYLNVKEVQYNEYNQKNKVTNTLGNVTEYEYTSNRQLKKTTLANSAVYEKVYDTARDIVSKSLVIEEIDPLGNKLYFTYDKLGNKLSQRDKRGNIYTFTYDSLKRVTSKTDPLDNTTYYAYNANGKLIKESTSRRVGDSYEDVIKEYAYDANSNIIEIVAENGLVTSYAYNKLSKVTRKSYTLEGEEISTHYNYDEKQRLTQKIIGFGSANERVWNYEYDALDRNVKVTNPLGTVSLFEYDNNSNLIKEIVGTRTMQENIYDKLNRLVSRTDANGATTTYEYDENSNRISMTDSEGNVYTYSYDSIGNLTQEISPLGSTTSYKYDLLAKVVEVTNANGATTTYEYDENSNLIETLDFSKNTTQYSYDALNRRVLTIDAKGGRIALEYDEVGNVISQTDKAGNVTLYSYDESKNLLTKTNLVDSKRVTQTYVYDLLGRVTSITDANTNTSRFTYSIFNEKISTTDALLSIASKEYNKLGRITKQTDANGVITQLEYDDFLNLVKVTQAQGQAEEVATTYTYDNVGNKLSQSTQNLLTTYEYNTLQQVVKTTQGSSVVTNEYDADSNLMASTDANENITQYAYDRVNNLISKEDSLANVHRYTYDKNSNLLSQLSPEGRVKQFTYNELNQRVKYIEDNANKEVNYTKNGQVQRVVNFNGKVSEFIYDALGRLTKKIEAKGTQSEEITQYSYDNNSNLLSITNAKGATIYYEYDALNRKVKTTDSDGSSKEYMYDKNSNLLQEIKADGVVIQTSYDNLNRKTKVRADAPLVQEYSYDALSRVTQTQEHTAEGTINTTTYKYDVNNRVISESQNDHTLTKEYDNNSKITKVLVDDTLVQSNVYNVNNNLVQISHANDILADISYDRDSKVNSISFGNAITNTIAIDNRNRESKRAYENTAGVLYSQATFYDANSNVLRETVQRNNQELIKEYSYDARDRLLEDNHKNHSFMYDKVGNQIFTSQNNKAEYREVNLDNEYISVTDDNIEYDVNGNIILYKNKEFIYDYNNRLIELKENGLTKAIYTYDAQNRRVSKTVDSITTEYIYNNNQVVQEYINDTLSNSYIYASYIDDPIAYIYNSETYYYLKDRQYSIQAITNVNGDIVESYSYNAFGIMTMKDQFGQVILNSNVNNSISYTGRRYDKESEIYYYRNRMYSPTLARFMQRDPKGYVDGMNLYAYVKNNPLRYLDPMGTTATTMTMDQFNYSQQMQNDNWLDEGGVTVFVGAQGGMSAGVSTATAVGEFWSLNYEDSQLSYTNGKYWNVEAGAGTPTASGGGEIGIMFTGDVEGTFAGSYLNNGGSIGPFGLDITSTTINDTTNKSTTGVTFNYNPISTELPEGHTRIGQTNIKIEERTVIFDFISNNENE